MPMLVKREALNLPRFVLLKWPARRLDLFWWFPPVWIKEVRKLSVEFVFGCFKSERRWLNTFCSGCLCCVSAFSGYLSTLSSSSLAVSMTVSRLSFLLSFLSIYMDPSASKLYFSPYSLYSLWRSSEPAAFSASIIG